MAYTVKIAEDQTATFTVTIPHEEIQVKYDAELTELHKKAVVPGFRPGRVPISLIRSRYGKALKADIIEKVTREALEQIFKDHQNDITGEMEITDLNYKEDQPLEFSVDVPFLAKPVLTAYKGLKVELNTATIGEEAIDKQVETLRQSHMILKPVDTPATFDCKLGLNVLEVDPSGLMLIGKETEAIEYSFGQDQLGIGSDEQLVGIKADETRVIQVRKLGDDSAPTGLIITPDQAMTGNQPTTKYLRVEAVKVSQLELPELNEDFLKGLDETLTTVEELRTRLRMNYENSINRRVTSHLENKIRELIISENPFPLSRLTVKQAILHMAKEKKIADNKLDEYVAQNREMMEGYLRWLHLRDLIIAAENLEVTDEEVENALQSLLAQYGESASYIETFYRQEEHMSSLRDRMLDDKLVAFLAANADVEKKELPFDEWLRLEKEMSQEGEDDDDEEDEDEDEHEHHHHHHHHDEHDHDHHGHKH